VEPGGACPTPVEAGEALVAQHLLGAVEAVLVHELAHEGARGTLVLHAGLHQVDGVHSRGARGCAETHGQGETHAHTHTHTSLTGLRRRRSTALALWQRGRRLASGDGAQGEPVGGLRGLEPHWPGLVSVGLAKTETERQRHRQRQRQRHVEKAVPIGHSLNAHKLVVLNDFKLSGIIA